MPKAYITEDERTCARLARWVYGEMKVRRITQRNLAEKMGITHQALSQKLQKQSFSYPDFAVFVREFQPSDKELREIIGI